MVAGIVLAGGRATRMGGGDKALRPLGGQPVLAHVIARLAPQVQALALSANGDPARFAAFGLPVLADSLPGFPGPLAGVLAGLDWAAGRGDSTSVIHFDRLEAVLQETIGKVRRVIEHLCATAI